MNTDFQKRYQTAKPSYIKVNEKKFADLPAGTTVLIPSPQDIESCIQQLTSEENIDLTELRNQLAEKHGADGTCPVMTGMNLRVVAELVFEKLEIGIPAEELLPVWKVIEPNTPLAKKLPGGSARIKKLREEN